MISPAKLLESWGYIALRFDMRGCGESEGPRAHVICREQLEDTRSAVSYLLSRPEVDQRRIATAGHSFGAAVSVYAGGVDERIAAVISSGGWGDGLTKFQRQHAAPGAWHKFMGTVERGRKLRAETGRSIKIPRFDTVPIPEGMRGNLAPGSIMEFLWRRGGRRARWRRRAATGGALPRHRSGGQQDIRGRARRG